MSRKERKELSSKELLEKIGFTTDLSDVSSDLLAEDIDGLEGDLVSLLRERYTSLKDDRHIVRPGMVLRWKPGLKNRRLPAYDKPCIVLEVLAAPVYDNGEPGSTYFREPLDMIVGLFLDEGEHRGDLLAFHACSERYQPWPDEEG
jgi:hypothetical protein